MANTWSNYTPAAASDPAAAAPAAESKATALEAPEKATEPTKTIETKSGTTSTPDAGTTRATAIEADGSQAEVAGKETASPEPVSAEGSGKKDADAFISLKVDGEMRDFATKADFFDFANESISKALSVRDEFEKRAKALSEKPLHALLDLLTDGEYKGNRIDAYKALIALCKGAVEEYKGFEELSSDAQRAWEAQARLEEERERRKKLEDENSSAQRQIRKAAEEARLLKEFKEAVTATGLPDTDEVKAIMSEFLMARRLLGESPTVADAAKIVASRFPGIVKPPLAADEVLDKLDDEKIIALVQKRPELAAAINKKQLEAIKQAREEKKAETAAPKSPEKASKILRNADFFRETAAS